MVPDSISDELRQALSDFRFRQVPDCAQTIPNATLLLKRQTWNSNRAVVVIALPEPPDDLKGFLKRLRKEVAFGCKFLPFFWGIGIQVIIIAPGLTSANINADSYVAKVDNQWAIVQSLYLIDLQQGCYKASRSWGQFLTGKFQDAISKVLSQSFDLRTE